MQRIGLNSLSELFHLLQSAQVTAANGKELMMLVIDGDTRTPLRIAQELGFVGAAISDEDVLTAV